MTQRAFTLRRQPLDLVRRTAAVESVEDVVPGYRRIRLTGDELRGFASLGADDHLRVFFDGGVSREFTPVAWDADAGSLTLDFVLHGEGVASSWAEGARPGDVLSVGGPRGSLVLEGRPEWWLLVGDETALPAIRRHLSAVALGVPVTVLVGIRDSAQRQPLETAGDLTEEWLVGGEAVAEVLVYRMHELEELLGTGSGEGFAFVAAEQTIVRLAREVLLDRWGLDAERVVVKGYWKHGVVEYHAPH